MKQVGPNRNVVHLLIVRIEGVDLDLHPGGFRNLFVGANAEPCFFREERRHISAGKGLPVD